MASVFKNPGNALKDPVGTARTIGSNMFDPLTGMGSGGVIGALKGASPFGAGPKLGAGGMFAVTPEAAAAEREAIARLRNQAVGKGPSITDMQYRQAMADIARQQQSAAASARGVSNPALLQRQAMQATQDAQMQLAGEAAAAKLAERRSADQALLGQAQAMRTGAINAANAEMGFRQQDAQSRRNFIGNIGGTVGGMFAGGAAFGGEIPGEPQVEGDHPANDTKPYNLSPGEIVIPRSAAKDRDSAIAFLDALKFQGEKKDKKGASPEELAKGLAPLLQAIAELNKKKKD